MWFRLQIFRAQNGWIGRQFWEKFISHLKCKIKLYTCLQRINWAVLKTYVKYLMEQITPDLIIFSALNFNLFLYKLIIPQRQWWKIPISFMGTVGKLTNAPESWIQPTYIVPELICKFCKGSFEAHALCIWDCITSGFPVPKRQYYWYYIGTMFPLFLHLLFSC